jgi:hypothetical protein
MIFLLLLGLLTPVYTHTEDQTNTAAVAYEQDNDLPSLTEEQIGRIATCIKTYPVDQIINETDEWLPLEMPLPAETSHMTEEQRTEVRTPPQKAVA